MNDEDFYAQTLLLDPVGKWASLRARPNMLEYVPTDRSDYDELARVAVAEEGRALMYVPNDRLDYGTLARIAVRGHGEALMYVPTDRDDYDEIARLAQ